MLLAASFIEMQAERGRLDRQLRMHIVDMQRLGERRASDITVRDFTDQRTGNERDGVLEGPLTL